MPPKHWIDVALEEVADIRLGRQRSPDKAQGDNLVPYLRAANVRWGELNLSDVKSMQFSPSEVETFRLRRDDILVVEASGSQGEVGKCAQWQEELPLACLQNTLIRVRSRGVEPRFLRWRLHSDAVNGGLGGAAKGIGIYHIGAERLSTWRIGLPPLGEQRRIVTKLDAIFQQIRAAKARLERLPALLEKLKRSILAAAFRGDLTADWRSAHPDVEPASALLDRIRTERRHRWEADLRAKGKAPEKATYEGPAQVDATPLADLPLTWAWASVDDVSELQLGQQRAPIHAEAKETYPYIRAANIKWSGLDLSDVKRMGFPDPQRYLLRAGDVLLSEASGSPSEVGKSAIWRGEVPDCCYQKTLLRARPRSPEVSSRWLHASFLADALLGRFARMAPGVGILHLTADRMFPWPIPVAPAVEQSVIIERLELALGTIARLEHVFDESLRAVERCEQAALAKAFRGELVPLDPNDEPAAALLDRIRAARAAAAPESPRRGRGPHPTDASIFGGKSNGHNTIASSDDSLDLVVAALQQGEPRLTATAIAEAADLGAAAVKQVLKTLVAAGRVRVHGKARGTAYEWIA